jgi:hypothetical protein
MALGHGHGLAMGPGLMVHVCGVSTKLGTGFTMDHIPTLVAPYHPVHTALSRLDEMNIYILYLVRTTMSL